MRKKIRPGWYYVAVLGKAIDGSDPYASVLGALGPEATRDEERRLFAAAGALAIRLESMYQTEVWLVLADEPIQATLDAWLEGDLPVTGAQCYYRIIN